MKEALLAFAEWIDSYFYDSVPKRELQRRLAEIFEAEEA